MSAWQQRVAVGALVCLAIGCDRSKSKTEGSPGPAQATDAVAVFAPWPHRSEHTFAVNLKSTASVAGTGAAQATSQPLVSFRLMGVMHVQVQALDAHAVQLLTWLDDIRFSETSSSQQADFESLAKELANPSGVLLRDGVVTLVYLPPAWSNFAASISRTLTSALQHPGSPVHAALEIEEGDATGSAVVRYEPDTSCPAGSLCLKKTKLKYTALPVPAIKFAGVSTDLSAEVLHAEGRIRTTQTGQLSSLNVAERLRVPMGPMASLASDTALDLQRLDRPSPLKDVTASLSQLRQMDASSPYTGPMRANYDALRIGTYTYNSALAELEGVNIKDAAARSQRKNPTTKEPASGGLEQTHLQERAAPFRAMSALLRTQPDLVAQAVKDIKKRGAAARTLIDALAMTETKEGAEALANLLQDATLPLDWRGAVASGLVRGGDTSHQTVRALQSTLSIPEIRVHALFGLGTIARKLAVANDLSRADTTVQILTKILTEKPTATVAAHALRGVSNSGLSAALPAVEPYLTSPSTSLRVAAVQALRLMREPRVTELIADRLLHDRDKSVRRAAAESASEQPPSEGLITAMQNAVTSDPDTKVRTILLETLVQWVPDKPELKTALELVVQEDARASLRRQANEGLQRNTP